MTATPNPIRSRKPLTIREAVEWAFATERARLDFDDDKPEPVRPSVSPIWTMMQRGALGTKIDGGGHSLPAHDADIIAGALARLPREMGGKLTAVRVAELARAGQAEDWGRDLKPRCIPMGWKAENQHGPQAVAEVIGRERIEVRGRVRDFEVLWCRVTFTATAERIASARAAWATWRGALAWLAETLAAQGTLERLTLLPGLPEAAPWDM